MTPVVKHPNPSITFPLCLQEEVKPEWAAQFQSKGIICLCTPEITFCRCIITPKPTLKKTFSSQSLCSTIISASTACIKVACVNHNYEAITWIILQRFMAKDEEKTTGAEPWHSHGSNIIFPCVCLSDSNCLALTHGTPATHSSTTLL